MIRPARPGSPPLTTVAVGSADPPERPVQRRRIFVQVIAAAVAVVALVGVVGVIAARRLAEAEAVNDAAGTADLLADVVVQPALRDGLLTSDAQATAAMDAVVRKHVLGHTIVRVKLWNRDGRILYSDEPRLIGRAFPLGDEERAVFSEPRTRADVSDLQAPENTYERDSGKLLEVYRPVWTPSGSPLLFETYFRYDQVTARSGQLWRGFAGVTLSSILVLIVLLMPILWRLLDRLGRSQAHRESLLQRAVDVSAEERRRIAGTLHDGVVQELAASSFTLAGSVERASALGQHQLAGDLAAVAGTVRTSIGGLRSLLVDIYPPSLATAGLTPALRDLAAGLVSRGVQVELDLPERSTLGPEADRLVFRVANECLTNVARHAGAQHVRLSLQVHDKDAVLEIVDDGVGFDVEEALQSPPQGHFGLRVLSDVVAASDAELQLGSAPGAGTVWQLRIPL